MVHPSDVAEWTSSSAILAADFQQQYAALEANHISPELWFYPDMHHDGQLAVARYIGSRLGIMELPTEVHEWMRPFGRHSYRLGLV